MIYNARSSLGAIALAPLVSAAVLDLPITFRNTYAIVDVAIGTPAKTHSLMFDTGSATAWIVDAECAEGCNNDSGWSRDGYNRNESSSSSELGTYAEISYLGGVTSGPGVADTFSLGDAKWSQSFMDANESSWTVLPADGFLGLAFSTITDAGTKTMVETMMQAHLLDEPRFSIYYGTELNDTGNTAGKGVLTIGGSEEEKYVDGDLTWVPLQRINGEYEVWRSTLRILTGSEGISGNGSLTDTQFYPDDAWGVFDSGAGTITVPPLQVDALYQSIGMNYTAILNGDHIPLCTEFNSSWSVSFTFGDDDASASTVTITGDQLARPGFAYRDDACNPPFDGGDTDGFFLFGTALLNQFYTVFDFGAENVEDYEPRVGFGQLKEEYAP
ncbi:Uu.00g136290.m01.CDS01 [Anthostomella pinea]|uniref:Uu.00g136290.m01.CDS01 n=1 Tax=Anthostomella pinea TaxID=933095 RepID=A0AAI8VPY0_9PEZI|nr:Uu.00g136290.m01.CDS01 [Anthostomella pinea]